MKSKIDLVREQFRANFHEKAVTEENTKQGLIEPILTILGWNLSDTNQIRREYKNVIDYALFNDTTTIYLEAKKLSKELSSAIEQVYKYALSNQERPEFVVVSNGIQWRCYSMKYNLEIFNIDLKNSDNSEVELLRLLEAENVNNGTLKNYANYINVENQVFLYLRSRIENISSEIAQLDSSLNTDDINRVLNTILDKKGKIFSIQSALNEQQNYYEKNSTSFDNVTSNYNIGFSSYTLDDLPLRYLMILDNFAIRVGNQFQSKVQNIYIGKTGRVWSANMSSPFPNYFVECENGNSRNNRNGIDYNRSNCVCFSYDQLKKALAK
ncbi:MAG: hypothetical protein SCALA702_02090 [Melioribacteraceae bacterium]|nr:MAG: hypothetical protein SCALA702_02090 [Melioribacteraceae bacterium]